MAARSAFGRRFKDSAQIILVQLKHGEVKTTTAEVIGSKRGDRKGPYGKDEHGRLGRSSHATSNRKDRHFAKFAAASGDFIIIFFHYSLTFPSKK